MRRPTLVKGVWGLAWAMIVGIGISLESQPARGCDVYGRCWPTCPRWVPPPPTELSTGNDPEDLKVHIVGPRFDTIEVYFQNQFYRHTFPNTSWLQYENRVVLAPLNPKQSPVGTFAVLHGGGTTVTVYGWVSSPLRPVSTDIAVVPSCPVTMQWVTDRIFKVRHGPGLSKETIVRFEDSATPFPPPPVLELSVMWWLTVREHSAGIIRDRPEQYAGLIRSPGPDPRATPVLWLSIRSTVGMPPGWRNASLWAWCEAT
jgi:hypothetical protein